MNTVKVEKKQALMIAHRGVSGLEKENTACAFVAAGNRSYFGIETDVHVTKDGKIIVIHDDNALRVSGADMSVEGSTFEALRSIRLWDIGQTEGEGRADLHLPSLKEYISICKKYEKMCVLELKNPMEKSAIGRIIEEISELDYLDHVIFISFAFENMVAIREFSPNQTVQFLTKEIDDALIARLTEYHMDLDIRYTALTREWMEKLHAAGIKVNCWTVNEVADADRLIEWGIDYITSNILE